VNASSNLSVPVYYAVAGKSYIDLMEGNPDFALQICTTDGTPNLTTKYVSWAYKAGNSTHFKLIGEAGGTGINYTQPIYSDGNCYFTPANWNFYDQTAVYPGLVYAVVSDDNDITKDDTWIEIRPIGNNNVLLGSYNLNNFAATLNEINGNIAVIVNSITGTTASGSQTIYPGGTAVNKQAIVLGVCQPTANLWGWNCASSNLTYPGVLNNLFTGVIPNQNNAYTRYLLVNGFNYSFCIGPDIAVTSLNVTPSSVYQSENALLNATVQNLGNVNYTGTINIGFFDGATYLGYATINGLNRGETKYAAYNYDTTGKLSGNHTMLARISFNGGPGNCNTSNDESTTNLTIKKTYNITVLINNTVGTIFDRPGRPYNVTIIADDSDGNDAANVTVKLTERNGLNLFAPVQAFDAEGERRGASSLASLVTLTNSSGMVDFAIIPTGNKLYLPLYSNENATDHIGNYSLYIELYDKSGTEKLQLYNVSSDSLIDQYNLTLANHTVLDPTLAEENTIYVYNHNRWVKIIVEFFVQVFGNVQKWIAP
ncbi:MAG: CARDB domain-containing protein, partial [Candidatus Nanoarchaeia archaeon]